MNLHSSGHHALHVCPFWPCIIQTSRFTCQVNRRMDTWMTSADILPFRVDPSEVLATEYHDA